MELAAPALGVLVFVLVVVLGLTTLYTEPNDILPCRSNKSISLSNPMFSSDNNPNPSRTRMVAVLVTCKSKAFTF